MLNTITDNYINSTEKFQNAEQLWFWFVYSKYAQNGFIHHAACVKRPCELLDVETLITKLYLSGKLSDKQLDVMKKFGDKRRAPHQYIFSENKAAMLWKTAMDTITEAAGKKGWLID